MDSAVTQNPTWGEVTACTVAVLKCLVSWSANLCPACELRWDNDTYARGLGLLLTWGHFPHCLHAFLSLVVSGLPPEPWCSNPFPHQYPRLCPCGPQSESGHAAGKAGWARCGEGRGGHAGAAGGRAEASGSTMPPGQRRWEPPHHIPSSYQGCKLLFIIFELSLLLVVVVPLCFPVLRFFLAYLLAHWFFP